MSLKKQFEDIIWSSENENAIIIFTVFKQFIDERINQEHNLQMNL